MTATTVAGAVNALVQDLDGEGLTMRQQFDRIERVVSEHTDAITVRVTPNVRPGAGTIEAMDAQDNVIATVRINNRGAVTTTDSAQAPVEDTTTDEPDDVPAAVRQRQADDEDRLTAGLHSLLGSDTRGDEGQEEPQEEDSPAAEPAPEPQQPPTIGSLLTALPRVGQRLVSTLVLDGDAPATPEQVDRSNQAAALHYSGKAGAQYVLLGAGRSDKPAKQEPAKAASKPQAPAKAKGERKPRKSKYSDEVRAAVQASDALLGKAGPHAKHHTIIRAYVAASARGPITPEVILSLAGVVNVKALRDLATRQGDEDKQKATLKALKPLGRGIDHQFCAGRGLAAVLVAYHGQLVAAGKAASS